MALHELLNCIQLRLDIFQIGTGLVRPFFRFNDLLYPRGQFIGLVSRVSPPEEQRDSCGAKRRQNGKQQNESVGLDPAHHQPPCRNAASYSRAYMAYFAAAKVPLIIRRAFT